MSEANNEIDLRLIYNKIKQLFSSLGDFISSIINVIKKRFILLVLFALAGAGAGIGLFYISKPVYISSVTLTSSTLSNEYCSDMIEDLELIIKDKTPELLAKKLNIDVNSVRAIKELEFNNYDEKLKKIYANKDTVVLGRPFKITVYAYNNTVFDTLQNALINYLENNEYALKRKKIRVENIQLMREKLKEEIHQLDSLKFVVASNLLPRGNSTGFVFGQPIDPVNIYKEGIRLFQDDLDLNTSLVLSDNIQVIQDFSPRRKPDSPNMRRNIFTYGSILFLLGLTLAFSLERKKKQIA